MPIIAQLMTMKEQTRCLQLKTYLWLYFGILGYKVILRLRPHPEAIGFIVKNNEGKKKKDNYVNTVDDVERITGYDFFTALPDNMEKQVESHSNLENWK